MMPDKYANLTKACGGALTIESITQFQVAMREYEIFMPLYFRRRVMVDVNSLETAS